MGVWRRRTGTSWKTKLRVRDEEEDRDMEEGDTDRVVEEDRGRMEKLDTAVERTGRRSHIHMADPDRVGYSLLFQEVN